jgi:hypothetical protein
VQVSCNAAQASNSDAGFALRTLYPLEPTMSFQDIAWRLVDVIFGYDFFRTPGLTAANTLIGCTKN